MLKQAEPRRRSTRSIQMLAGGALILGSVVVSGGQPASAATVVVANYQMNEAAGATTMIDSSGNGYNGSIGSAVQTGATFAGSTGYRWAYVSPTAPPAKPERLVLVPSRSALNPDSGDYAIEFRYRTTRSFGNIVQKGQNGTPGGYFKFEQPNGNMTCLFKGGNGQQRAIKASIATNDGNWHVIRCERTSTYIRLIIDGVQVGRLNGPTGNISNNSPVSIAGKSVCDQVEITCDYFTGDIDYVKLEKQGTAPPANQAPTARITSSCVDLTCTFDSSTSTDSDGQIVSRSWSLSDGTTSTQTSFQRTFAAPGTYTANLTVIDDDGAPGQAQQVVSVGVPSGAVSFVGQSSVSTTTSVAFATQIPASVQPGDTILVFTSTGSAVTIGSSPSGSGWNAAGSATGSSGASRLWWKTAGPSDPGSSVSVGVSGLTKGNISVLAYRGAAYSASNFAVSTANTATRVTPTVSVANSGSWGISFWVHRDSTSTSLTGPGDVTGRLASTQSGGGHLTVLGGDSNAAVPTGTYGNKSATAQAASSFAITWTVILRPA
jgi:hypothetical protein